MKHLVYRVVAMFAILFSVNTVSAQTSSGEISGRVVDSSGAAIANAAITLTNQLTGQQLATTTDKFGGFVFTALQPSTFSVSVRANGFKELDKRDLQLSASQRLSSGNLQLEVGAVRIRLQDAVGADRARPGPRVHLV